MVKKRIALIGFHLHGGGTARVMANLSNFFDEKGLEVHNIIIHDEIGYDYSGTLYNLGKLKSRSNTIFNKLKRFIYFRRYMKNHQFDFIIDFRFRKRIIQEFLISRFVYDRKKTIYTIHSSKLNVYLPESVFWAKVIYGKCYKVLALTNEMEQMAKLKYTNLLNISSIYNPIVIPEILKKAKEEINFGFNYVIGAGSFDVNTKQFDKLIAAYAKSLLPKQQIHLVILGQGKLLHYLKKVAKRNKVNELVHFSGFESNPYKFFSKSKFFVLSSKFEGLPMVILEALACEVPVVAFNSVGIKEVVCHQENGLLIEDQNIEALTNGLNTMLLDEDLYKKCKSNSFKSIQKFSIEVIGNQWLDLMNIEN